MTTSLRYALLVTLTGFLSVTFVADAWATRIKDIAYVQGVRNNQLLGYGLVVGLAGTGDYGQSEFTVQSTVSMLSRMGIRVDRSQIQTRNVAAVMVTADLPPFARSGQTIDVLVSSMGNARSLQGGTLLMAPLMGPDGEIYAVAQGALSVGGYEVRGGRGSSQTQNHVTAGRIPDGAIIEEEIDFDLEDSTELRLILQNADFTTAVEVARRISEFFQDEPAAPPAAADDGEAGDDSPAPRRQPMPFSGIAEAVDASTIRVDVPEAFSEHIPQFISMIELLEVTPSRSARVVINERTGTVVLGGDVRLSEVAVAHGNLTVHIDNRFTASQPAPFGQGTTEVLPSTDIDVQEGQGGLSLVPETASIADVVNALNAIGVTPRDLIAILQAIKAAGALNAELVIE